MDGWIDQYMANAMQMESGEDGGSKRDRQTNKLGPEVRDQGHTLFSAVVS